MATPGPPAARGRRRPPPPPASPAQPSRRRRQWGLALTGALVVGAGIIALVLALQTGDGDEPQVFERDIPPGGSGAGIGLAATFDPPPGDGAENDRAIAAATDGDTSTAWRSECYRSAAFGGLKEGVGLVVELPEHRSVDAIGLIASPEGWSAEVHVAGESGDRLDDWGPAVGSVESASDGQTTIELDSAAGRFVLVFFTALSPDPNPDCGGGNPFAVTVSELVVSQD